MRKTAALYVFSATAALGWPLVGAAAPEPDKPLAVVVAPWSSRSEALLVVARADGSIVGGTAASWIVVATSSRPDFIARLRDAGAWMTFDGSVLAGCSDNTDKRTKAK